MLIKQSNLKIWRAKTKEIKLYLNQEIVDRWSENSYEKSPIFKVIKVAITKIFGISLYLLMTSSIMCAVAKVIITQ